MKCISSQRVGAGVLIQVNEGGEMSIFGYNTLEEQILLACNRDIYLNKDVIRALLSVVGYINDGFDSHEQTYLKVDKHD